MSVLWAFTIVIFGSCLISTNISGSRWNNAPISTKEVQKLDRIRADFEEKLTGCNCPIQVNTTGTWMHYCGHALTPMKNGKCNTDAVYRCINGRKEAILQIDCGEDPKQFGKCRPAPDYPRYAVNCSLT